MLLSLRSWNAVCLLGLLTGLVPLAITGCGDGKQPEAVAQPEPDDENSGKAVDPPTATSTKKKPTSKPGSGKKPPTTGPMVDGVPLDVFFDRPLQVAADKTAVGAPPAVASMDNKPAPSEATPNKPDTSKPAPDTPKPAAGGATSWDKVVSTETLLDSVKACRIQWDQRLASVQIYNSAQLEMPVFATEMILLAEIARLHPGEIRWKGQAKFIRAMGVDVVKIASGADGKGKKAFDTIKSHHQKICDILDGNTPPGLPEAADDVTLEETANIKYLMKRLERAETNLKNNAGSEDNLKKNAATSAKDVTMYVTISHAIKDKSYGYDAEEDYNKQANAMNGASVGMAKALADNNFSEFDTLRNTVTQKCSDCHMTYRTGQ